MNIGSNSAWPASALSNFTPHPFIIDGVFCASMEGFLQSLKFKNIDMQEFVCSLVGRKAKFKGKKKNWRVSQVLYWRGIEYKRTSQEYQNLLDRAYTAMFTQSESFKKALLSTSKATLVHSIGKTKEKDTVLTEAEFCSRLTRLRDRGYL